MMSINKLVCTASLLVATTFNFANGSEGVAESRKTINPTEYGYAQANAVARNNPMLNVSGQVGISSIGKNDFYSQVDRSFDRLKTVLEQSGAIVEGVAKITLLIVDFDPDKLAYMVTNRKVFFAGSYLASTRIPVTRLYTDGVKFEIDAVAVLPS